MKKMSRLNKILSVILSTCIVFTLLPSLISAVSATDTTLLRGDINGDGCIDAVDVTLLTRYVARIDEHLGGDWLSPVNNLKLNKTYSYYESFWNSRYGEDCVKCVTLVFNGGSVNYSCVNYRPKVTSSNDTLVYDGAKYYRYGGSSEIFDYELSSDEIVIDGAYCLKVAYDGRLVVMSENDGEFVKDRVFSTEIPNTGGAGKIGVILVGDENEGYTWATIDGVRKAMAACGLTEDDVVWCYNIPENEECYDMCYRCIEQGCKLIITNSYSHQSYAQQAAKENPDVQFVCLTGDTARKSGLPNFANVYANVFESRYVSGVVAGMKLKEMMDAGLVSDPYIGYVGAYPYAEVVSGYTGFFLGIRSVVPAAHMDVQYTNSWFNQVEEARAAMYLMNRGCVIIGQHADSTGAPAAVQAAKDAGKNVYSVGYNVDMRQVAPTAALTSATIDWSVYFSYLFNTFLSGRPIATDWSGGYDVGAVGITALGSKAAKGTAEKVTQVEAALANGTLHVFDTSTFTVGGKRVTSAFTYDSDGDWTNDTNEGIVDGYYHESEYISAPSFALRIDGITELN